MEPIGKTAQPGSGFDAWFASAASDRAFVDNLAGVQATAATDPPLDIATRRARLESRMATAEIPAGLSQVGTSVLGHRGEWLRPTAEATDPIIVYLHGGALVAGSIESHRVIAARLALCTGLDVFSLDYPLAPENPFPASIQAIADVVAELATPRRPVILAGDSAGGGLAVASALDLVGHPPPMLGLILLSPWLDLTCTTSAHLDLAEIDPILKRTGLLSCAKAYLANASGLAPGAFPLSQNLSGLPPTLVQVGEREILRDDAIILARLMRAQGAIVELQGWEGMCHVWHACPWTLASVQAAYREIGKWTRGLVERRV
jgi:epsilon-lactone hydrolase